MKIKEIVLEHSELSSRHSAGKLRNEIYALIKDGYKILINLKNVECMSYSYADELFG